MGPPFFRSFALSPLDGASVRKAHCEQASIAVREAHCAQATVARLVTFESLKWKYSFATNSALFINSALFMKLGAYASGPTLRDRRDDEQRGSSYDAKFNVAEIGAVNMGEIGAVRKETGPHDSSPCVARVKILDRVGAYRADCGVYYCCFQCSSFAVLRMDRVYNITYICTGCM